MNIILCSTSDTVRQRWQNALQGRYTLYEASRLQDLNILLRQVHFDVLLLHSTMVEAETVALIHAKLPGCRLFVLSDRPDDEEGLQFLKHGAVGYGNACIASARLQEAVRLLSSGSVWIGQKLMERLIRESASRMVGAKQPANAHPVLQSLSRREHQVAQLVAEGCSNQEISRRLAITERTVKAHLGSIYRKTGTRGRLNLALLINNRARRAA